MKNKIHKLLLLTSLAGLNLSAAHAKQKPQIIHEWGTFTLFMDSNG